MTHHHPDKPEKQLTRRDVLKSVGKYSAAATGATVVALSAEQALAQASASNGWNCRDYYPWWVCWFLGLQEPQHTPKYGGWEEFPENRNLPDDWNRTFDTR